MIVQVESSDQTSLKMLQIISRAWKAGIVRKLIPIRLMLFKQALVVWTIAARIRYLCTTRIVMAVRAHPLLLNFYELAMPQALTYQQKTPRMTTKRATLGHKCSMLRSTVKTDKHSQATLARTSFTRFNRLKRHPSTMWTASKALRRRTKTTARTSQWNPRTNRSVHAVT